MALVLGDPLGRFGGGGSAVVLVVPTDWTRSVSGQWHDVPTSIVTATPDITVTGGVPVLAAGLWAVRAADNTGETASRMGFRIGTDQYHPTSNQRRYVSEDLQSGGGELHLRFYSTWGSGQGAYINAGTFLTATLID